MASLSPASTLSNPDKGTYMRIYTYSHIHIYTNRDPIHKFILRSYTHMYMHTYIHPYIPTYRHPHMPYAHATQTQIICIYAHIYV